MAPAAINCSSIRIAGFLASATSGVFQPIVFVET